MLERFGMFTTDIGSVYKSVQRIKKLEMERIGLKGTHVMCLNFLRDAADGLTGAEICQLAKEDKAGISRALSELEDMGYICYKNDASRGEKRNYRTKAVLSEKGLEYSEHVNGFIIDAVSYGGATLSDDDRRIFYKVLKEISGRLEEYVGILEEREEKKDE